MSVKQSCPPTATSGLYPGILGKGPLPNWEKKCRQNVEIGEKKHIKLEAYSTTCIMNI